MKGLDKLTYRRLSEALIQTGGAEAARIRALLEEAEQTEQPLPELLIRDELFSEWELVRLVSDHFSVPILYPLSYEVDANLIQRLGDEFLRETNVLPLGQFGTALSVVMPVLTPIHVLQQIERNHSVEVFPFTGPISENTQILLDLGVRSSKNKKESIFGDSWSKLFDDAEATIQEAIGEEDSSSFLDDDGSEIDDDDSPPPPPPPSKPKPMGLSEFLDKR